MLRKFLSNRSPNCPNIACLLSTEGRGRSPLDTRFISYFNVVSFDYSESSLEKILLPHCSNPKIVNASIELYKQAKAIFPQDSWNLRDLKKIVSRVGEVQKGEDNVSRVWAH